MRRWIPRMWLTFLIRCTETRLSDLLAAYSQVSDARTFCGVAFAIEDTRKELAALRAKYTATFPAGQRRTWSAA